MGVSLITIIEIMAILVGALSGFVEARRKRMDIVGVFTVAFIAAFGGGTLRDILLDKRPLFWVMHQEYVILIFVLALVAAPLMRTLRQILSERLIVVADAVGLGLFAVAGVSQAQAAHMPMFIASMMGVITGIFGGVLRDIVCNEVPMVLPRRQTLRHLRLLRLLDVHRPAIHRRGVGRLRRCGPAPLSSPFCGW